MIYRLDCGSIVGLWRFPATATDGLSTCLQVYSCPGLLVQVDVSGDSSWWSIGVSTVDGSVDSPSGGFQ